MTAYAGFKNLTDYIDQRCARDKIARSAVAERLGWPRNYMHDIYVLKFRPSRLRADELAKFFGDEPRLVRVLADVEAAPSDIKDKKVAEIVDLVMNLDEATRAEAMRYLRYLRDTRRKG